jgi:hypothetical protein
MWSKAASKHSSASQNKRVFKGFAGFIDSMEMMEEHTQSKISFKSWKKTVASHNNFKGLAERFIRVAQQNIKDYDMEQFTKQRMSMLSNYTRRCHRRAQTQASIEVGKYIEAEANSKVKKL